MYRFFCVTALTLMTSGCMVGALFLIPKNDTGVQLQQQQTSTTNTPSGTAQNNPSTPQNGPSGLQQLLIGTWNASSPANGNLFEFKADGTVNCRLNNTPKSGTYAVNESGVVLNVPGESNAAHPAVFSNNNNTLQFNNVTYLRKL